jgi:hypothetical protein
MLDEHIDMTPIDMAKQFKRGICLNERQVYHIDNIRKILLAFGEDGFVNHQSDYCNIQRQLDNIKTYPSMIYTIKPALGNDEKFEVLYNLIPHMIVDNVEHLKMTYDELKDMEIISHNKEKLKVIKL